MPDWLLSVPAFIVAIGLLVAVHEYGHFWVARRLGVRVLRFSIGFGPKIWGTRRGGTEYWLAAIPLGGYVKMLDEREAPVAREERHRAFNRQPAWKRILIVAAGPAVNFLFAIFCYWWVFAIGVPGIQPLVAAPEAGTAAYEAGMRGQERVIAIDGREVVTWHELRLSVMKQALFAEALELTVSDAQGAARQVILPLAGESLDPRQLFSSLGLLPYRPPIPPVLAEIMPGEAAEAAGLQIGDRITAFNGTEISEWSQLVALIARHPEAEVVLGVERSGEQIQLRAHLGSTVDHEELRGRLGAGVDVNDSLWQDLRAEYAPGVLGSVPAAMQRTWDMSVLTLGMLGHMLVGDVSWRNISGPVQIASFAGQSASIGLDVYLAFLALVSVSLGVLNLLPIPVLDGGHLLYYFVELLRGRPLSERVQEAGQRVGFAVLAMLMTVALYNDFLHLFGG